jgi:hypothetical protein
MKQLLSLLLFFLSLSAGAQDTRCLRLLGIPLEGPVDSVASKLHRQGFTDWGTSSDETELHFRGSYYGIRCKLIVSCDAKTRFVTSAYITIGPYGSKTLFNRNFIYYKNKLTEEYGEMSERNGAWYYIGEYGMVKLSDSENETGAHDIKVFLFCTAPYYKDVLNLGLHGNVMEVVTENPVAEEPMMHFEPDGRLMQADMTERNYSVYGYLTKAAMLEQSGEKSLVDFLYDDEGRLVKRTLTNKATGIRSVNEYFYNDDDEIERQVQRVYDKQERPLLSITMRNSYSDYDENDNWTKNHLSLTYWDQDNGTQQAEVEQVRTISYY